MVEAADGAAALKLALRESPALILMDIGLPKYGGLAVIRDLRKQRKLSDVPIVAVTAYDSKGLRLEAENAGVTDYVTKPVELEEFSKLIEKLLQKSQARR